MGEEAEPAGVTGWVAFIGNGGPRFLLPYEPGLASPEYALLLVNATSRASIDDLVIEIEDWANATFPEIKPIVRPLEVGPPVYPPVEFRISGRDTARIFEIAEATKQRLREIPGTKLVDDNWGARAMKVALDVDETRALRAGVTNEDIAVSMQTFLDGIETTWYREGDELIPIVLRSRGAQRNDIDKLETMNVYTPLTGQSHSRQSGGRH